MAKNKSVEPKQSVEEMVEEIRAVLPTSSEEVKAKAALIRSFFDKIHNVEGVTFDPSNPDHELIAAFTVGMRRYLRR